jgi:hypothetical protein
LEAGSRAGKSFYFPLSKKLILLKPAGAGNRGEEFLTAFGLATCRGVELQPPHNSPNL